MITIFFFYMYKPFRFEMKWKKKLFHKDTFKGLRNAEYLKAIMKKFMLNKSKNDSLQQNGCCVIIKMKDDTELDG